MVDRSSSPLAHFLRCGLMGGYTRHGEKAGVTQPVRWR